MHANIEDYFNSREVAGMIPEFSQFLQFNEEVVKAKEIQPFRTEWRIAAPDLQLGGSVDFVGKKKDGSYVLMDWKRSKNLPVDFHRSFGKFGRYVYRFARYAIRCVQYNELCDSMYIPI